ncbi:MAG: organomercurial lyase [Anaerolineales bacterium]|jgi:hypothetical protein
MDTTSNIDHLKDLWRHLITKRKNNPCLVSTPPFLSGKNVFGNLDKEYPVSISFHSTPFLIRIDESILFASTPIDCLILPSLLGCAVDVESTCPTNGIPIQISISEAGISSFLPNDCVVSIPIPEITDGYPLQSTSQAEYLEGWLMRFFSSPAAASLWTVAYPNLIILNLHQVWDLVQDIFVHVNEGNAT